ncbi:MAG: endo alpha-1,4 polygalactosaminidase [Patescibacteria group bacterium]
MRIFKIIILFLFLISPKIIFAKPSLDSIKTYANAYFEYKAHDLKKLKKFDIVVIDPYDVPNKKFVTNLKKSGTIVLAYIDIGEAEVWRVYFKNMPKDLIIKENPDWPGNFFANVNDLRWHKIILNEAISYLFQWGNYDGLMLDMLDTVDEYPELKPGMISLVKKIHKKYPKLLIVPNRGFVVLPQISKYIDAIKYEEMCSRYDFDEEKYIYEDDEGEQKVLFKVLKKHKMPVLVLDHLQTHPKNLKMAKRCFNKAKKMTKKTGAKFLWYGNSIKQDLPIWSFLPYRVGKK